MDKMTVKINKSMSRRRFASYAGDLKRWGLRYDPATQTWTMLQADRIIADQLRSAMRNGDLIAVENPAPTPAPTVPYERVRTADLVADLARQGLRPSFGRGATPVEADDYGDQPQVL